MAVFETVPRLDAAPNGAGRILCAAGYKYAAPTELVPAVSLRRVRLLPALEKICSIQ